MLSEYLLIGEISKPQGIAGEVKVQPHTGDPNRFLSLTSVFLKAGDGYSEKPLASVRVAGGYAYLTFPGVNDRDKAEAMRGQKLYVDRARAVKLAEDETFICDLIGCVATDDSGRLIGTLTDVMQPGAGDVYAFQGPMGEVLVPALKSVFLEVDVKNKRMLLSAARLSEVAVFDE